MARMVQNMTMDTTSERMVPLRCCQCGGTINNGRELVVDDEQLLCDGCYRLMVNPDSSGDVPSKWF